MRAGSLAAEKLGRVAVDRWTETGDIADWVEACHCTRQSLGDPYGRSSEYAVFVAGSVLELSPAQHAQLRRDARPALADRLASERDAEPIPDPAELARNGRRVAASCVAALTCGSAADEFAPLPTVVGLAAAVMATPSPLLEEHLPPCTDRQVGIPVVFQPGASFLGDIVHSGDGSERATTARGGRARSPAPRFRHPPARRS